MVPYAIMIGEKYTYFTYHRYKFIETDKIEKGSLLNATNYELDPYNYYVEMCGEDSFKKLEHNLIHTCWPGHGENGENEHDDLVEEDEDNIKEDVNMHELEYTNGRNEIIKVFSQKCVI